MEILSNYWNFSLRISLVREVDLKNKVVKLENGKKDYDMLVVSAGSTPNFYDVKGTDLALPAYWLSSFELINRKLKNLKTGRPKIVVVGAGYVGLEVAAEIMGLFKSMGREAKITVVEKMDHILPGFGNELARKMAFEALTSRGLGFSLGKGVARIAEDRVLLEDGSSIESDLTIWTGGVKGSDLASRIVGARINMGYIEVDERLLIRGGQDAFAVGDVAFVSIGGKVAQKMAGEALEQAVTVARNIGLILKGEVPRIEHTINYPVDYPKVLLSLGEGRALLIYGPQYASLGSTEYFLKRRIDLDEMMSRFPK